MDWYKLIRWFDQTMLENKRVLLTSGRAPATLHLARILDKKGHHVYCTDTFGFNITGASKHVQKSFITAPPRQSPKRFINELKEIIRDYNIDILIPTCEETFYVSMYKEKIAPFCQVFVSDIDTLNCLHNKWHFNQWLRKQDLPYPKSYIVQSKEEALRAMAHFDEFVLKPTYSRFADKVFFNDKKALDTIQISSLRPWIVQELIKGKHFASFSIVSEGKLTAHATYPVEYRVRNGAAVYFETTQIPQIEKLAQDIAQKTNYTGFLSLDYVQAYSDKKIYALECNPRLTSGIHLYDWLDDFMPFHGFDEVCYPKPHNRMMLVVAMLLYNFPEIENSAQLIRMLKKMALADDAVFSWKDIKPCLAQIPSIIYFYQLAHKHNISLLEATTHHIEWNGEMGTTSKEKSPCPS